MRKLALSIVIVIALLIAFCWSVSARNSDVFEVKKASYPIFVDDERVSLESPALNFQGKTYVYIRELCDILGYEVVWDEEEKCVQIDNYSKDYKITKEMALRFAETYLYERYPTAMENKKFSPVEENADHYRITVGSFSIITDDSGKSVEVPVAGGGITICISKKDGRILSEEWGE